MTCRLFGVNPLSKINAYINWSLWNTFQWNFSQSTKIFIGCLSSLPEFPAQPRVRNEDFSYKFMFNFHPRNPCLSTLSLNKMNLKMLSVKCQPFCPILNVITHWGRVMHTCVGNLTIIGSDNGLSPGRRQAITWTNVGILLIGPLGTNFSEMLIELHTFSFKKIHLKMSSGKWRPFCLVLNSLMDPYWYDPVPMMH